MISTISKTKNEEENRKQPILCIVIPCYNEEAVLPITSKLFREEILHLSEQGKISAKSRVLFIDDGSRDATWQIIEQLSEQDVIFCGIKLSRNRGHQHALLAGLMEAKEFADITISIDCDGQDDIHAMDEMINDYLAGSEVVYGVRSKRDTDTAFKRLTAEGYYKFLRWMGADIVYNHADYRLISSRVLKEFANFHEVNIFLRGLIPLVGFKSSKVYYERHERLAGESHYPLKKMLSLAFDGITSLSVKPIHIISFIGLFIALLSFIGIVWSVIQVFVGNTVPGWGSMICILCFVGGIQMLSLGVIGEYIGKIYLETKARPRYIIEKRCGEGQEQ